MKSFWVLFLLLFQLPLFAGQIKGNVTFQGFDEAEAKPHLTWIVESTKVGLFSSDVYGYVLNYQYSAKLDEKNMILRDMELKFPITSMNSDNDSRDEKLHNKCMGASEYKNVIVKIAGPIYLKDKRARDYQGTVLIRGKEKPFSIKISSDLDKKGFKIKGSSTWSLEGMEIPDPSIAVAKLSDEIRLKIHIPHLFN